MKDLQVKSHDAVQDAFLRFPFDKFVIVHVADTLKLRTGLGNIVSGENAESQTTRPAYNPPS